MNRTILLMGSLLCLSLLVSPVLVQGNDQTTEKAENPQKDANPQDKAIQESVKGRKIIAGSIKTIMYRYAVEMRKAGDNEVKLQALFKKGLKKKVLEPHHPCSNFGFKDFFVSKIELKKLMTDQQVKQLQAYWEKTSQVDRRHIVLYFEITRAKDETCSGKVIGYGVMPYPKFQKFKNADLNSANFMLFND